MLTILSAGVASCISLSAIDGDTIRCDGENMRLLGNGVPGKSGVDAPEIHAVCARERMLGIRAKLRLAQLLRLEGIRIEVTGKRDRWKRPLVRVRLPDGKTAEETMIEEGYAVTWHPGTGFDWCQSREKRQ